LKRRDELETTSASTVVIRKRTKKITADGTNKSVRILRSRDLLKLLLSSFKTIPKVKQGDRLLIGRVMNEGRKALNLPLPDLNINLLLMLKTCAVPLAGKHVLKSEHVTNLGVGKGLALVVAVNHDVDNGTKRRAQHGLSAILEVVLTNDLLDLNKALDGLSEAVRILLLRVQHVILEHVGIVEHTSEEVVELTGDTPAETRSLDELTLVLVILHALKIALLLKVGRITLELLHTRHDLGSKEADIVTEGLLRADLTSRSGPATKASKDVRNEKIVKISREGQSVERTLSQSTLAASASGGRAGAADAADEIHEQLGEILIVQRVVAAKVGKSRLGDADTAAKHDEIHRDSKRLVTADTVEETHGNVGDISILGIYSIRTDLKVTRVGTALAVDETSVGRADIELLLRTRLVDALGSLDDKLPHGLGELLKTRDILSNLVDLLHSHGLEVGDEVARLDKVSLALSIKTAVDTIIGTLEKTELAVGCDGLGDGTSVLGDIESSLAHVARRLSGIGLVSREPLGGHSHGCADIILHLHLGARDVIDTSLEGTPHVAVRRHTDTEEASTDLTVVELNLVAIAAIDKIHGEVSTPVQTPLLGPEALHVVHDREDVRREVGKPGVVLVGVNVARSQQLDDAANGTLAGEERTVIDTLFILVALGVVIGKDLVNKSKVLLGVVDKERAVHESTVDVLGELTLATTRHSARLVKHSATAISTDQTPCRGSRVVDGLEAVTVGKDVNLARDKTDGLLAAIEGDGVLVKAEGRVLRDVEDVGETLIDSITLGLKLDIILTEQLDSILEGVASKMRPLLGFIFSTGAGTKGVAREGEGATAVLLICITVEVSGVADVRLNSFLQ